MQKQKLFLSAGEAAEVSDSILHFDGGGLIKFPAPLHLAGSSCISFLSNPKYVKEISSTKAGFLVLSPESVDYAPKGCSILINDNPYLAFSKIVSELYGSGEYFPKPEKKIIHKTAIVSPDATMPEEVTIGCNVVIEENVSIGNGCVIMPNTFIGRGSVLGENCYIYDNVSLYYTHMGDNCVIRSGARVGGLGFGFAPDLINNPHKNQHIAKVVLGQNVDVGANACIDRGFLIDTYIGQNTKIDNLVQIGHGVSIGRNCFFAAQAGVSGSTIIKEFVWMGGQSATSGHITIEAGNQFGGQCGIDRDITEQGKRWLGSPAMPIKAFYRMVSKMRKLI